MQIKSMVSKTLTLPLILIIRAYQVFISPFLGQNCRFYPSCSCYAHQALQKHGLIAGSTLAIKRIVKCQPFHPGGIDEVPENKCNKTQQTDTINNNTHCLNKHWKAKTHINTKL